MSCRSHKYLHSTMLLLYPPVFCALYAVIPDLHSTMLLLYRTRVRRLRYILLYLHSTMLLLYPKRRFCLRRKRSIYIPLCFYFICRNAIRVLTAIRIYIPLCFYFIACSVVSYRGLWGIFTFHYASTLSY